MKFLDRADDKFIQAATDDSRRPELIKETSRRRTIMFLLAVVISGGALLMMCAAVSDKNHNPIGGIVAAIEFTVAAMTWMQVFKCESDLRLLKIIEKIKK